MNKYSCHSRIDANMECVHLSRLTDPCCEGCATLDSSPQTGFPVESKDERVRRLWRERQEYIGHRGRG